MRPLWLVVLAEEYGWAECNGPVQASKTMSGSKRTGAPIYKVFTYAYILIPKKKENTRDGMANSP